ncbi:MAG: transcriptional regulator [Alphaproteobacteria bacterium]|nr:MAG: transcriptional regulator [Alphaproteobacteria bacterium]
MLKTTTGERPGAAAAPEPLDAAMEARAEEAAVLMKALSNPCRLMILCLLADGEKSVHELEERLAVRQPTVSQHLARLRAEGFVATRREGRQIYYRLADERVRRVLDALYAAYCAADAPAAAGA